MSYSELKTAAIQALGMTRQGFEYRAKQCKNRYGPMTTEQAIALVAYDAEVDVSRYLDAADLEACHFQFKSELFSAEK